MGGWRGGGALELAVLMVPAVINGTTGLGDLVVVPCGRIKKKKE